MHIDLNAVDKKERYKLLMSSILPRPIALVTTQDDQGRHSQKLPDEGSELAGESLQQQPERHPGGRDGSG